MPTVTLPQLNERLKLLPPEKLAVVYDFVSYLSERELNLRGFVYRQDTFALARSRRYPCNPCPAIRAILSTTSS